MSNAPQDVTTIKPFNRSTSQPHKRTAFTLAEVLITLAIIGVVAALTIPTIISKYQIKSLETKVTKFYSQMLNAVKLHMADEGVDKVTETSLLYCDNNCRNEHLYEEKAKTFLHKYFKVVKDCEQMTDCFADSYSSVDGSETSEPTSSGNCSVLADGTSVCLGPGISSWGVSVQFDINGKKGPNKAGYDYFYFTVYHDGSINESITPECRKNDECDGTDNYKDEINYKFENCKGESGAQYGAGCFAKFLDNGFKMDY